MIAPDEGGGTATLPTPIIAQTPAAPRYYIPPGAALPASDPTTPGVVKDTKRIKASMSPWMKVAVVGATGAGLFLLFAILKTRK